MFLCLILVLQFTAETEQHHPSSIARAGDEVTLPCENVINDHRKCGGTTWIFSRFLGTAARDLVEHGQIVQNFNTKSDRLSVTENCSLVIKKVTVEDVGRYFCQRLNKSGQTQIDTLDLSVMSMAEHEDDDEVTLTCSVSTYGLICTDKVKWLFRGNDVDKDNQDLKTSLSCFSSNVTFTTSHFVYTSKNYELLACEVTDGRTRKVSTFSPQSSGKNTVEGNKTTPGNNKTTPGNNKTASGNNKTTPGNNKTTPGNNKTTPGNNKTASGNNDTTTKPEVWWWLYVIAAVGSAALFITAVALVRRKRNKGNKTQMDENTADPEDGVSYTSISHTKRTNSKTRVRGGEDAVTYSTVKAPSPSAGASADPSDFYATIN